MPRKCVLEMVAWKGAGMAIHGKDDVLRWYKKNEWMHPDVRLLRCWWVDRFEYSFVREYVNTAGGQSPPKS